MGLVDWGRGGADGAAKASGTTSSRALPTAGSHGLPALAPLRRRRACRRSLGCARMTGEPKPTPTPRRASTSTEDGRGRPGEGGDRSTFHRRVVGDVGRSRPLSVRIPGLADPLLVASADGVGTKLKVAIAAGSTTPVARTSSTTASTESSFRRPASSFSDYIALGGWTPASRPEPRGLREGLPRRTAARSRRGDGRDARRYADGDYDGRRDDRRRRRPSEAPRRVAGGRGRPAARPRPPASTNGYSLARKNLLRKIGG